MISAQRTQPPGPGRSALPSPSLPCRLGSQPERRRDRQDGQAQHRPHRRPNLGRDASTSRSIAKGIGFAMDAIGDLVTNCQVVGSARARHTAPAKGGLRRVTAPSSRRPWCRLQRARRHRGRAGRQFRRQEPGRRHVDGRRRRGTRGGRLRGSGPTSRACEIVGTLHPVRRYTRFDDLVQTNATINQGPRGPTAQPAARINTCRATRAGLRHARDDEDAGCCREHPGRQHGLQHVLCLGNNGAALSSRVHRVRLIKLRMIHRRGYDGASAPRRSPPPTSDGCTHRWRCRHRQFGNKGARSGSPILRHGDAPLDFKGAERRLRPHSLIQRLHGGGRGRDRGRSSLSPFRGGV